MSCSRAMKKVTGILLIILVILAVAAFTGCSSTGQEGEHEPAKTAENTASAGVVVAESDSDITIVDQAGREVTVPKDIDSIALSYRVVIRFLLNLGQGDKITGIGKSEPFLEELQPSLRDCADVGKGVADIEALAELGPDLYIHKASDTETLDAVSKIGIPSIGIEVETPDDMLIALDLLGKILGAEEKAKELSEYYRSEVESSKQLTASLGEADRKTAIVMGSSIGSVADGSMLQGKMLEIAGAVNSAADIKAADLWPVAGTEQIMSWDPDYIFITGSGAARYTPEDIYSDKAWSEMKAVKEHHVYVVPSKLDSWEFPGVVSALGIDYMISTMYPDLMSDEELETKVSEFYEMAYGRTFGRDELGY